MLARYRLGYIAAGPLADNGVQGAPEGRYRYAHNIIVLIAGKRRRTRLELNRTLRRGIQLLVGVGQGTAQEKTHPHSRLKFAQRRSGPSDHRRRLVSVRIPRHNRGER